MVVIISSFLLYLLAFYSKEVLPIFLHLVYQCGLMNSYFIQSVINFYGHLQLGNRLCMGIYMQIYTCLYLPIYYCIKNHKFTLISLIPVKHYMVHFPLLTFHICSFPSTVTKLDLIIHNILTYLLNPRRHRIAYPYFFFKKKKKAIDQSSNYYLILVYSAFAFSLRAYGPNTVFKTYLSFISPFSVDYLIHLKFDWFICFIFCISVFPSIFVDATYFLLFVIV